MYLRKLRLRDCVTADIQPTPTVDKIEPTKPPAVEVKTEVQVKVSSNEPEQLKIIPTKAKPEEPKPKKATAPVVAKETKKKAPIVSKVEGSKDVSNRLCITLVDFFTAFLAIAILSFLKKGPKGKPFNAKYVGES